jgi:hypothetical protein
MNTMKKTPDSRSTPSRRVRCRGWLLVVGLSAACVSVLSGCNGGQETLFTRLAESRHLASDLRVQFNKAADASNRAVMADTDDASVAFAAEAEEAKTAVRRDAEALMPVLRTLDYQAAIGILENFRRELAEYEEMDQSILKLAVQNSNLKAQKLAFGPEREAADAFREALEAFARSSSRKNSCQVSALVFAAVAAVREIQSLEAPHISEPNESAMAKMEKDMDGLEASARSALRELSAWQARSSATHLVAAKAALERFNGTHLAIVALSRQNTNVRSLGMSLGDKRKVVTACDSRLAALQDELASKGFAATR